MPEALRTCLAQLSGNVVRPLREEELDDIDRIRRQPGALVWLDLSDPGDAEIHLLEREFGVHPLATEDVRKRHQRPKIDTYPDQHMIVAYEVRHRDEADGLAEIHLFSGPGYLVTVHWGGAPGVEATLHRFRQRGSTVGQTPGMLLYAVLDAAVDSYFPLLDGLSERIDALEDRVLRGVDAREALGEVLRLKRRLLELRRVLAPMRDVANSLLRRDIELIEDQALPYYQDLYDHLVRVLDQVDVYRDLVASSLDANLAVQSNTLNAVMKRLTAFTVILMVPTLIAGIYGMNFDHMPELASPYGYAGALAAMVISVLAIASFFRARDWL
jgi:magnesium transporter